MPSFKNNLLTSTSLSRPVSSSLFEHHVLAVEQPVELPHFLVQTDTQMQRAHFLVYRDNVGHRMTPHTHSVTLTLAEPKHSMPARRNLATVFMDCVYTVGTVALVTN